ncbi:unnamed protein product, partial [Penicillium discolor]
MAAPCTAVAVPATTAVRAARPMSPGRPNLRKGMSFTFLFEDVHHRVHDGCRNALAAQHLASRGGHILGEGPGEQELQDHDRGRLSRRHDLRQGADVVLAREPGDDRLEAVEDGRPVVLLDLEDVEIPLRRPRHQHEVQHAHHALRHQVGQRAERGRIRPITVEAHEIELDGPESELLHVATLHPRSRMAPPSSPARRSSPAPGEDSGLPLRAAVTIGGRDESRADMRSRVLGDVAFVVVELRSAYPGPPVLEPLLRQVEDGTLRVLDFLVVRRDAAEGHRITEVDGDDFSLAGLPLYAPGLISLDDVRHFLP